MQTVLTLAIKVNINIALNLTFNFLTMKNIMRHTDRAIGKTVMFKLFIVVVKKMITNILICCIQKNHYTGYSKRQSGWYCFYSAFFAVNILHAQQIDILFKGGHVIDPKNKIDGQMDVAITNGKIFPGCKRYSGKGCKKSY